MKPCSNDLFDDEACEFCNKCKNIAKNLIHENACLESDLIVYEEEMGRILSKKRRERFKRSNELLA